jgi:hypothetical protein
MTKTISAAANPAMVNNLVSQAMVEEPKQEKATIINPTDNFVTLPGGYLTPAGELVTDAEVRELTGKDEEAISRANSTGKALLTILQRGTVRVGNERADEQLLDRLLSGDRDTLLLGILKATFGYDCDVPTYCGSCDEFKVVSVDLNTDIKIEPLKDKINDRVFTVEGKKNVFTVQLPTGVTQKELIFNADKTVPELNTILLENTVIKIDNNPVLSKLQVQNMGLVDRKTVVDELNKRMIGPKFEDITVTCPDCESEVTVPINLGTLFRF